MAIFVNSDFQRQYLKMHALGNQCRDKYRNMIVFVNPWFT
jgi:hypothetical protein